jgi:hypothetical protein
MARQMVWVAIPFGLVLNLGLFLHFASLAGWATPPGASVLLDVMDFLGSLVLVSCGLHPLLSGILALMLTFGGRSARDVALSLGMLLNCAATLVLFLMLLALL